MYAIYFLEAGDNSRESHRKTTRYDHGGRAFKMHELPIDYREQSEEVFTILIGSLPPQLVTIVPLEVNGVMLEPGDKIRLKPPTELGDHNVFRLKIFEYEFDLTVFKYYMEVEE